MLAFEDRCSTAGCADFEVPAKAFLAFLSGTGAFGLKHGPLKGAGEI
jgi:hypothetical protein